MRITSEELKEIARSMGLDESLVKAILEDILIELFAKNYNMDKNEVKNYLRMDLVDNEYKLLVKKRIVEKVENPVLEISLKDAKKIYEKKLKRGEEMEAPEVGKEYWEEWDINNIDEKTLRVYKTLLIKRLKDAQTGNILAILSKKEEDVINAKIFNIDRSTGRIKVLVEIPGKSQVVEGEIPPEEQIPGEIDNLQPGMTIKAYLKDIKRIDGEKGIKGKAKKSKFYLILSRADKNLVRVLLEKNVPEISEGIVEIKSIARIPGVKTKVAVFSKKPNIDAAGACIGTKGSRIFPISQELGGEKIEIVRWSPDIEEYIKNILAVDKKYMDYIKYINIEKDKITLVIDDQAFGIIVGKQFSNIKILREMLADSGLKNIKIEPMTLTTYIRVNKDLDLEEILKSTGLYEKVKLLEDMRELVEKVQILQENKDEIIEALKAENINDLDTFLQEMLELDPQMVREVKSLDINTLEDFFSNLLKFREKGDSFAKQIYTKLLSTIELEEESNEKIERD